MRTIRRYEIDLSGSPGGLGAYTAVAVAGTGVNMSAESPECVPDLLQRIKIDLTVCAGSVRPLPPEKPPLFRPGYGRETAIGL